MTIYMRCSANPDEIIRTDNVISLFKYENDDVTITYFTISEIKTEYYIGVISLESN